MVRKVYRIGELASRAGVTRRTIHYYISKGLIPPAEGAGVSSYYNEDHYHRIVLIKKLQDSYLPLSEIRKIVSPLKPEQVVCYLEQYEERKPVARATVDVSFKSGENQQKLYCIPAPHVLYERVHLGEGVELHFPAELRESKDLKLQEIIEGAQKLLGDD